MPIEIGINKRRGYHHPSYYEEVMLMIEEILLHISTLLLTAWLFTAIIAITLIIVLAIILSK